MIQQSAILMILSFFVLIMASAEEVLISGEEGKVEVITLSHGVSFDDMISGIRLIYTDDEETNFELTGNQSRHVTRDYSLELTQSDRNDIRYIITTMADKSLATLLRLKGQLETAGDRIDHVHPLRFLEAIFGDEQLKVAIHNIRKRGWVWGDFFKGISTSLGLEYSHNNVTDEMVHDFASIVKISPKEILPSIHSQKWAEFIDILIKKIPRSGNPGRYDM